MKQWKEENYGLVNCLPLENNDSKYDEVYFLRRKSQAVLQLQERHFHVATGHGCQTLHSTPLHLLCTKQ